MELGSGSRVVAVDRRGKAADLVLGRRLGGGGEGTVFEVAEPRSSARQAVKVFFADKRQEKMPKVRAMLKLDPEAGAKTRRLSWPLAVVRDAAGDGEEVGYSMPLAPGELLLDATQPLFRNDLEAKQNASLDLFSFHWLAENLAKTVVGLHDKGHVVGDLKDQNTKFDPITLEVFLIDTDSFGISVNGSTIDFPARTATPEWSPPESLHASVLGPAHDLFALAVLYHWLLFGTHPFTRAAKRGEHQDTTVDAIRQGRWIYGRGAITPPGVPPLSLISPRLQELFQCAFEGGIADPALRPSAKHWEAAFREARSDLTWCRKHPLHVFDRRAGNCPWCGLTTELWSSKDSARSRTIDVAQAELRRWGDAKDAAAADFACAARRLAANPSWAKTLPEVAEQVARVTEALDRLRSAADDAALVGAAEPFASDGRLHRIARTTENCGVLLDRAARLAASRNRLQAAVDAASADGRGRFRLAGERALLEALRRAAVELGRDSGLLAPFAERGAAAGERVEAAEALAKALADGAEGAIARLREELTARGPRLGEIAEEGAGVVDLARGVAELHERATAAETTDEDVVELWDKRLASPGPLPAVVDAAFADGAPSLRAIVDAARRSFAAVRGFERLLQSADVRAKGAAARDQAIAKADPTARISPRRRTAFARSEAGQELAVARGRIRLRAQFEKMAAADESDAADQELAQTWAATPEREQLGLPELARARIGRAERRMAHFAAIREIAERVPPQDEALIAALGSRRDFLGLKLASGQSLQQRVEAAETRLARRDEVAAAIAAASGAAASLESEQRIAAAWDAAEPARLASPQLFEPTAARAARAALRLEGHRELTAALQERHGRRADLVWRRCRGEFSDFEPVQRLAPQVEALLARYSEFVRVLEQAKRGDAGFDGVETEAFELKDADDPVAGLGQRSLRQHAQAIRRRNRIDEEMGGIVALGLDPGRQRSAIARIAETLSPDDLALLESDGVHASLAEAVTARGRLEAIRQVVAEGDVDGFLAGWDEVWHPRLSGGAEIAGLAREMMQWALTAAAFEATMERVGDDRVRLTWQWPLARASSGVVAMTVTTADRRAPARIDAAEHVATVFRNGADKVGHVEIVSAGRRLAAALFAGCVIGGEMAQSARPVVVVEPKRRLAYRFKPAALGRRDDRLWIRSPEGLQAPPLRIVHVASRQTVSVVGGFRLAGDFVREFDLRPLRAAARGQSGFVGGFRRIAGADEYKYAVELDDPADQDWLEIVHPNDSIDSQLGFAWQ